MNSPEAVAYLERDYDQMVPGPAAPIGGGLAIYVAPGWAVGANVKRPMFEIIDDMSPYRHLDGE